MSSRGSPREPVLIFTGTVQTKETLRVGTTCLRTKKSVDRDSYSHVDLVRTLKRDGVTVDDYRCRRVDQVVYVEYKRLNRIAPSWWE